MGYLDSILPQFLISRNQVLVHNQVIIICILYRFTNQPISHHICYAIHSKRYHLNLNHLGTQHLRFLQISFFIQQYQDIWKPGTHQSKILKDYQAQVPLYFPVRYHLTHSTLHSVQLPNPRQYTNALMAFHYQLRNLYGTNRIMICHLNDLDDHKILKNLFLALISIW